MNPLSQLTRDFSIQVVRKLHEAGFTALWAGGCVRDLLLNAEPYDYDVATNATPHQVQKLFPRSLAVGAAFGVIEVLGQPNGVHVQVATFRSDGTYSDGRRPDSVCYGSAEEDAQRRDFTINGLFMNPLTGEIIDYIGGKNDLERKVVRAIGNAKERFTEDKLRLLRAIRFVVRLGFDLEADTRSAIAELAHQVTVVSPERISDELHKMLKFPHRHHAVMELKNLGLWQALLGDALLLSHQQSTFAVTKNLPTESDFPLCWSALLWDLQPHLTQGLNKSWLTEHTYNFRFSNEEREELLWLLDSVPYLLASQPQPFSILKPLVAHEQADNLWHFADAILKATEQNEATFQHALQHKQKWTKEEANPPPLLTGKDLYQLGVPPGPCFGIMLNKIIRPAQLDEVIHNHAEASELVKQTLKNPNWMNG